MDDFIIKKLYLPSREAFYGWKYQKRLDMRRLTRRPLPSLDQYTLEVDKIRPSHKRTKGIYPSYIYFDIGFIAESPDSYLLLKIRSLHHKQKFILILFS